MARPGALGGYVRGDTLVHALDARAKVAALILATVGSFGARSWAGLALMGLLLAGALAASRTTPRAVLRGLRPALVILSFSLLANAVVLVGQPGISWEGLLRGARAVVRIALVVGLALVVSSTTTPPALAEGLAAVMAPLRVVGVPVGGVSTALSVALRFIPLTMEEIERIRCAQLARGARLDAGGVVGRLRGWGQVLVPLIVGLFRRADELARAMSDRCYTGEQTSMAGPLALRDGLVIALFAVSAALALVLW